MKSSCKSNKNEKYVFYIIYHDIKAFIFPQYLTL